MKKFSIYAFIGLVLLVSLINSLDEQEYEPKTRAEAKSMSIPKEANAAKAFAANAKILGCKDSCCKKKWGICYKWCFSCPFGSGGISVGNIVGWLGK